MTEAKTETTLELIEAARWCGFKAAEGWPQQFTPGQVARLQHWHEKDIKARTANISAWVQWLKVAIQNSELEATPHTATQQITPAVRHEVRPGSWWDEPEWSGFRGCDETRSFLGGTLRTAYVTPARYKDVTTHLITAPVLAAFLRNHEKNPSAHLAAWFAAHGVGGAPEQNSAAPEPESVAQRNARWLRICEEEASARGEAGAQARAIRQIAKAEKVTEAAVKKGIQKARDTQTAAPHKRAAKPRKHSAADPFSMVKRRG